MKYLVFLGPIYYPLGGWDDFQGGYNDLVSARKHIIKSLENSIKNNNTVTEHPDWGQIVNLDKRKIIEIYTINSHDKIEKIVKQTKNNSRSKKTKNNSRSKKTKNNSRSKKLK